MAEDFGKNIKAAKAYADALDAINKKTETQNKAVSFLAQEMGLAYGGFIKQIEKSNDQKREELKLLNQANASLREQQKSAGDIAAEMLGIGDALKKTTSIQESFNKSIANIDLGSIKDMEGLQKRINDLSVDGKDLRDEEKDELNKLKAIKQEVYDDQKDANKDFEEAILKSIDDNELLQDVLKNQGVDLSNNQEVLRAINKLQENGLDTLNAIAVSDKATLKDRQKAANIADGVIDSERERNRIAQIQSNEMREQIGLWEKLQGFAEANAATIRKDIWKSMKDYDQAISDAGKDFGFVGMKSMETSMNMASLGQSAARFGVSMKDAVGMMGALGDELKTIDQDYLANSVEHFMAIEKATGISSEEITTIAGEMMRAGKSAEDVENYMEGANKTAKMFGVNTKKILQGVARNIDKMRTMGFQGGEESLTKMVATAERLRMNVDEIFDVAKKARTIEGAMEMASELQLAGGSFANIDPMSLLAAARKGPEELQKILTQMGDDIGTFNKETGQLEFDAVDSDRLQMVADATGQSVDSISKMIQKNAEDNAKVDLLGLSTSLGDEEKNFLTDMTKLDKNGQIQMDPELAKLADSAGIPLDGVENLGDLNQDQIKALMDAKAADLASLEEQAEQNQSFDESMTALKDAFMNMFIVFEPVIKGLTSMIQTINESPVLKGLVAGLVGLLYLGPKLIGGFQTFKDGISSMTSSFKGFQEKGLKGVFSGATPKEAPGKDSLPGLSDSKDSAPDTGKKGGLQSLAEGLKAMGDKDVFKGIGAVALAGPALLLMLPGIPTLLLMAGVGALGKLVEAGFRATANGISAMGEAKGVLKGALAMLIIGASLIPFAFALQMMAAVEWSTIGMMVVGIIALAGVTALLGFIAPLMLAGAVALAAASVGLLVFGAAIMVFAIASQMMQGMSFDWLGSLGWNLLLAAPGLLLGGLALMVAAPALIFGSMGLMALGVAAQALSGIDWASFAMIGTALTSIIPGLLGFSVAGLMFANPITLLGMILMMGTLGGLAMIMLPLSDSLVRGADGLERFASGLDKLQEAANNLDFERLEALKDLSMGMALAGLGGGMLGDQITKIAEALAALSGAGKGGGGGGGTQKIQIDLKLNGRDLQSIIVDDTSIVS